MKFFRQFLILHLLFFISCNNQQKENSKTEKKETVVQKNFPHYNYSEKNSIPKSTNLNVPEDGVGLPDGKIIVADNNDGLHVLLDNGSTKPFGNMRAAGYLEGGARGVFLENDNKHILVSCINSGKIFRVDIVNETSEVIFQHTYGVNNIYKDKKGNIWFTQSGENPNGTTQALDEAFASPIPTGALFRLQNDKKQDSYKVKMMADSLFFANGITMDEKEEYVYVAELRLDRILRFQIKNDTIQSKEQFSIILSPDNLERGPNGDIWVASLIQNKIFAMDMTGRNRYEVFSAKSTMNEEKQQEWVLKNHLGKSLHDIGHPDMWNPLTGPLTGLFWSYDQTEIYFTGLGTKILKYPFPGKAY